MNEYNIIIGENGSGKTRYLINHYNEFQKSEDVDFISNSLTMPLGRYKNPFRLNGKGNYISNFYHSSFTGYFSTLFDISDLDSLFYTLEFMGFDPILHIERKPIYKLIKIKNLEERYFLEKQKEDIRFVHFGPSSLGYYSKEFYDRYYQYINSNKKFKLGKNTLNLDIETLKLHIEDEKKFKKDIKDIRRGLFYEEYHLSKKGVIFNLNEVSSGEIYLLCLGLHIRNFLNSNFNSGRKKTILIDEPENSLHPKWQKGYISFLRGITKYDKVQYIIATHSPFLTMSNYDTHMRVSEICDGTLRGIEQNSSSNSIEEIYLELFKVLTPKNRYLSEYCNDLLVKFSNGLISKNHVSNVIDSMIEVTFDDDQKDFLNGVYELLLKVERSING
ncbi:TPA: AAA family ATPase [Providencia alcalifaciens]